MVTVYCEATKCKYHNGSNCGADFITIIEGGECQGYTMKLEIHPTEKELKLFEEAKKHCPFCDESDSMLWRGDEHDSIYCTVCGRVLVCNDIGLFEETDGGAEDE